MFKRILVPLDGSATAERALPIALRLARVINGTIVLLRVVNTNWPSQTTLTQQLPAAARFEAEKYLHELVKSGRFPQVSIETLVSFGIEAPTILSTITTHQIDLVVISGCEYSNINRWVVGSVVDKVAWHAEVPVMLLHHDEVALADPHLGPPRMLRILVPLNGSVDAEVALNPAAELIASLASPLSGTIHMMRVIKHGTSDEEVHLQQANDYLQHTLERIRKGELAPAVTQYKITTTWSVTVDTDVTHSIITTVEKAIDMGGYDIIAITTHGLASLSRWIRGGTTESVYRHVRQPLLIVQPHPTSGEHEHKVHVYENNPSMSTT